MALVNGKPLIDAAANIHVHGRGGFAIVYQQLVAGVFQDISALNLFFEIQNAVRVALLPGADATKRVIRVEAGVMEDLPLRQPVAFALRDETGDPAIVTWDGYLVVRGFQLEPSA